MIAAAKRWAGGAAFLLISLAVAVGLTTSVNHAKESQALKSENLTGLRAEALDLFPRGSHLDEAEAHLEKIGFVCEPLPHPIPDISGPSLRCASNGRGYPDFPAVNVVLLSRNGLVSDVDVWNVMARADTEPDDIDFTAIGASNSLPAQLRRPEPSQPPESPGPENGDASAAGS